MDKIAGELTEVWIVRDPTVSTEMMSEFVFPWDTRRLPQLILGTGVHLWHEEHTKLYTDAASAQHDADARLKKLDVEQAKKGLHRHVTHDGRILYVTVPKTATRVVERFLSGG